MAQPRRLLCPGYTPSCNGSIPGHPLGSPPLPILPNSSPLHYPTTLIQATLAAAAQKLPLPIHLTLFNGSSTSAGNIIHYVQTTLTFTNGQQQGLQLLVTCLHAFALIILGLLWLCSTNPHVNWQNLTLHFDCQALECLEPISFDVSTADYLHTPPQLRSKSAWWFVLNA
ncbi:hypothetical protein C0993_005708 [Termitomyces sp. T159_Od127]|nr:hypothetical protein C0993_005708 [Termitomyces sp. T159_Od127]